MKQCQEVATHRTPERHSQSGKAEPGGHVDSTVAAGSVRL